MTDPAQQELGAELAGVKADILSLKAGVSRIEAMISTMRAPLTTVILVACAMSTLVIGVLAALGSAYSAPYGVRMTLAEKELDENDETIERVDSRLDEIERTTVRIDFLEKRQTERDAEIGDLDKRLRAAGH